MIDIQKSFRDFITGDTYGSTTIHYDMNAIKIRLHEYQSDERYILFYIYSPWRITHQGRIINSSDLHPRESELDEHIDYMEAFSHYTKTTEELCKQDIVDVTIQPGSCDLFLEWADGTFLESFCLNPDEWSYHIYDKINGKSYDVCFGKVNEWAE